MTYCPPPIRRPRIIWPSWSMTAHLALLLTAMLAIPVTLYCALSGDAGLFMEVGQ